MFRRTSAVASAVQPSLLFTAHKRLNGRTAPATQVLHARFSPSRAGEAAQTFHLVCDNCQVKRFTIAAQGVELAVTVPTLDGRTLGPGELAAGAIWLGAVICGTSSASRSLVLSNATPVALPFRLRSRRLPTEGADPHPAPADVALPSPAGGGPGPALTFDGEHEAGEGAAQRDDGWWEDADGSVFSLDPWRGTFPSRGETPLMARTATHIPSPKPRSPGLPSPPLSPHAPPRAH